MRRIGKPWVWFGERRVLYMWFWVVIGIDGCMRMWMVEKVNIFVLGFSVGVKEAIPRDDTVNRMGCTCDWGEGGTGFVEELSDMDSNWEVVVGVQWFRWEGVRLAV